MRRGHPMLIERDELCALIPHAGNMCLLDAVQAWDQQRIVCVSYTHRQLDNPLRRFHGKGQVAGALASIHAVEYGAQAMAVHGGLLARESGAKAAPGYLAALRDVQLYGLTLDPIKGPLIVEAEQVLAGGGNLMYNLRVSSADVAIVSARATVITSSIAA